MDRTFVAACAIILSTTAVGGADEKPLTADQDFLRQAYTKIESGTFGVRDRVNCDIFLSNAKGMDRLPFLLVLARFHRLLENRPIEALKVLGPTVIDTDKVKIWEQANAEAEKAALAKWQEEERQAKLSRLEHPAEKPSGLQVSFPSLVEWSVSSGNAECALELARCLMDLNRHQEALAVVNSVGAKFGELPRVLASECGGDIETKMQLYKRAVDFYEFGLKSLRATVGYLGGEWTTEQQRVRSRIERKLAEARRLLETEKYGKGWVLYRDAERKRRTEKAYADALILYEDIRKEFPRTVWAEAATCYSIKCLLALSEPNNARNAEEAVKGARRDLDQKRRRSRENDRTGGLEPIAKAADGFRHAEQRLRRLEGIPIGPEAAQTAERMAHAFISQNEFGLYRGEVLFDIGCCFLESRMDLGLAGKWFSRAAEWLAKVDVVDAELASFDVPAEARDVSSPPSSQFKTDWFGQRVSASPEIGDVVNRRTASWYLTELRKRLHLYSGLILLCREDREGARAQFAKYVELDAYMQRLSEANIPNVYSRLIKDLENGHLRFQPMEMRCVSSPRKRLAFRLAEFAFETEDYRKSESIYRRILAEELGPLSRDEASLAAYELASALHRQFDFRGALEQLGRFDKEYFGTVKAADGLLAYGNLVKNAKDMPHSEARKRASQAYMAVIDRYPNSAASESARLFYILNEYWDRPDEQKEQLERFIRTNQHSDWVHAAREVAKCLDSNRAEIDKMIREKKAAERAREGVR